MTRSEDRAPIAIRYCLGFTVDVVGYSSRTIDAQQQIQDRLVNLLEQFVTEIEAPFESNYFQQNGDGFHYFLPDYDVHKGVSHLLSTLPRLLATDNEDHVDRMRLRMAMDVGTVGLGSLGFIADAVIKFSRLVGSEPIRNAVMDHDVDLVVLVSDTLYRDVITRFDGLTKLPFQHVNVEVKDFRTSAYLLICR